MIHITEYEGRVACIAIKRQIKHYYKQIVIELGQRWPNSDKTATAARELGAWGLLHLKLWHEDIKHDTDGEGIVLHNQPGETVRQISTQTGRTRCQP